MLHSLFILKQEKNVKVKSDGTNRGRSKTGGIYICGGMEGARNGGVGRREWEGRRRGWERRRAGWLTLYYSYEFLLGLRDSASTGSSAIDISSIQNISECIRGKNKKKNAPG